MSSVEQEADGDESPIITQATKIIEQRFRATSNFQQSLCSIGIIVQQLGKPTPSVQYCLEKTLHGPDGFTATLHHPSNTPTIGLPNLSLSKKHPDTPDTPAGVYEHEAAAIMHSYWDGGITIVVNTTVYPETELFEPPSGGNPYSIRRDAGRVFIYSGVDQLGPSTQKFLNQFTYDAYKAFLAA